MPELPPVDGAAYLIRYLFEVGPVAGDGALTFCEIETWCRCIGIKLRPWESRFLSRLSREYMHESQKATAWDYPPPWQPELAAAVVTGTQAALRALANL